MPGFLDIGHVEVVHCSKRHKGKFPESLSLLDYDAIPAYEAIADIVVVDGMFRTAEVSRWAIEQVKKGKKHGGVLPPAWSRHGFGLAIDIQVDPSMRLAGIKSKKEFDLFLEQYGWYCQRHDHSRGHEDFHFNWLRNGMPAKAKHSGQPYGERELIEQYGDYFKLDKKQVQMALRDLHLYGGAIDGIHGYRTKAAVKAFQNTWGLKVDGIPGKITQRVLAYVAWGRHDAS